MTHITAGDRLMMAEGDISVPAHPHGVISDKTADFPDEDIPQHSFEVRLGRPARLLLELQPHTCRWPLGDLDDPHFHWCGCPCMTGAPYCAVHMWLARPPSQRKAGEIAYSGWEHGIALAEALPYSVTYRTIRPGPGRTLVSS